MPHQMMRPGQFISAPIRWLAQYGRGTGQVMAMPNFGMDYVVKRIRPADLEDGPHRRPYGDHRRRAGPPQ
ncbi:hypothetical protein V2I01_17670 [Micromonospora sp. BRA006-A]|nr:hypothetical protein [Micromonospora sp. BRA006-A]